MVKKIALVGNQEGKEAPEKVQNITVVFQEIGKFDYDLDQYLDKKELFADVAGHQLGAEWVGIIKKNGDLIIFPRTEVKRVEINNVDKE